MKVAVAVCMALLAVVLVQAEHEMGPPVHPDGNRVANARPATPRQFPYMAYIEAAYKCCGSLITRSAVLASASYCVEGATEYKVRLGSIYRTGDDTNAWSVESAWALVHPKYNKKNFDNNIAIIYLPRLAPLNEFIQLVHLPSSPVVSSYVGCQGIVSAWGWTHPDSGMSDVLRWAEVLVIPNDYCKKLNGSWAATDRQLCAGTNTTTVKHYDWGAPLVLYTRGRYMQIGIFYHYMAGSFNTSTPAIYTRVTSFMDWIKLNTESD